MQSQLSIDVAALDAPHKRAIEDVIGTALESSQVLLIQIVEGQREAVGLDPRPPQSIEEWASVFDGLTEREIEQIDEIANSRADLSRNLT